MTSSGLFGNAAFDLRGCIRLNVKPGKLSRVEPSAVRKGYGDAEHHFYVLDTLLVGGGCLSDDGPESFQHPQKLTVHQLVGPAGEEPAHIRAIAKLEQ